MACTWDIRREGTWWGRGSNGVAGALRGRYRWEELTPRSGVGRQRAEEVQRTPGGSSIAGRNLQEEEGTSSEAEVGGHQSFHHPGTMDLRLKKIDMS